MKTSHKVQPRLQAYKRASIPMLLVLLVVPFISAQTQPGGTVEHHQFDEIDLATLNITIDVPIWSVGGPVPDSTEYRGVFKTVVAPGSTSWETLAGFNQKYSTYGGNLYWATSTQVQCTSGGINYPRTKQTNPYYVDVSGASHPLPNTWHWYGAPLGGCTNPGSQAAWTGDRSGLYVDSIAGDTTDRSGNVIGFNAFVETDPNGNSASNNTNSLGRTFLNSNLQYYDASGTPQAVTISTTSLPIRSNWNCPYQHDYNYGSTNMQTSVNFPDGTSLQLSYEPTAGYSGYYSGRLASLTLPTGGTVTYHYSGGNAPGPALGVWCGSTTLDTAPAYSSTATLTRTTSEGTWTYTTALGPSGSGWSTTTVTDPSGNNIVHTFFHFSAYQVAWGSDPIEVQRKVYQGGGLNCQNGCTTSNLLATYTTCYNNLTTFGNCANASAGPANYPGGSGISEKDVYTTLPGVTGNSEVATTYDLYGNVTGIKQYDFGASSPKIIKTITYGSYSNGLCAAISTTIQDRACDITVSDGSNTISDTRYTYNSTGHPTQISRWTGSQWLNTTATYNSNGTPITITLPVGAVSFDYAGSGGCNNLLPTSVTIGALATSYTYDCNVGKTLKITDPNNAITTASFTANGADPFYRVKAITEPLNEVLSETYGANSVESAWTFGSFAVTDYSYVDSLGRPYLNQGSHGTAFDTGTTGWSWGASGPVINTTSVPCSSQAAGTPCTSPQGTIYHDALGRAISIVNAIPINPGTETITYSGKDTSRTMSPPPSGENNKVIQTEYDGLGRVTSICEILNSGGSACGQALGGSGILTTFTYATLAGGSKVTATRGLQSHTWTYDGLGRLTSKTTPEAGTTTYYYDSVTTAACGTVNQPGQLLEVQDNAGHYYCYQRDSLGRPLAMGVSTGTACRRFWYDTTAGFGGGPGAPSGYAGNNILGRLVEAETDDCTWPTSSAHMLSDEWFSYDAEGQVTDVWESTPHSAGYYHTSATYYLNGNLNTLSGVPGKSTYSIGLDSDGRPYSSTYGSTAIGKNVIYNPAGQPTSIAIGSGSDNDAYSYDPYTGLMSGWTFTIGTANENATLNWNANETLQQLAISDGFNSGGTQTCTFSYDDAVRLLTDNCGSVWNQSYSYDQYNNITKAGNPGTSWNPGYSPTNNHITGASYDSNGQVTYDLHNSYAWDDYHKMINFNSGSSLGSCGGSGVTCLTYDAFGRFVEKNVGGVYTEYLYSPLGLTAGMNGQTTTLLRLPVPGGAEFVSNGSGSIVAHVDWLGSARVAETLGHVLTRDVSFSPYGEEYADSGTSSYLGFAGMFSDVANSNGVLFDTPNREFDAGAGSRWLSPDPVDGAWNAYAYPTNPNSETDSTGLCPGDDAYCVKHPEVYGYINFDGTYCDCGRSGSPGITIQSGPNRDPGNSWGNLGDAANYTMFKMANVDWGMSPADHAPSWLREGMNHVTRSSSAAPAQVSGAQNTTTDGKTLGKGIGEVGGGVLIIGVAVAAAPETGGGSLAALALAGGIMGGTGAVGVGIVDIAHGSGAVDAQTSEEATQGMNIATNPVAANALMVMNPANAEKIGNVANAVIGAHDLAKRPEGIADAASKLYSARDVREGYKSSQDLMHQIGAYLQDNVLSLYHYF